MPFTPLASDQLGRRAALFLGSVIMLGGVALQCASTTIAMFVGARFVSELHKYTEAKALESSSLRVIVGFGLAFALNAAPLLVTELAYPTQVSYWNGMLFM